MKTILQNLSIFSNLNTTVCNNVLDYATIRHTIIIEEIVIIEKVKLYLYNKETIDRLNRSAVLD